MLFSAVSLAQTQEWICGNDDTTQQFMILDANCTNNSDAYNQIYKHKENWVPNEQTPIKILHVNFNIWQRFY